MKQRLVGLLVFGLVGLIAVIWGPSWYRHMLISKQLELERVVNDVNASAEEREAAWRKLTDNKTAREAAALEASLDPPPETLPSDCAVDIPGSNISAGQSIETNLGLPPTTPPSDCAAGIPDGNTFTSQSLEAGLQSAPAAPPPGNAVGIPGSNAFADLSEEEIFQTVQQGSIEKLMEETRKDCDPALSASECEAFSRELASFMKYMLADVDIEEVRTRKAKNQRLVEESEQYLKQMCSDYRRDRVYLEDRLQQPGPPPGVTTTQEQWDKGNEDAMVEIRKINQFLAANCSA